MAEPFAQAPVVRYFADGARREVADTGAGHALAHALGYRKPAVARWQQHWYAALAALVLLLAAGFAIVTWGLPAAAEKIAENIPPALDQRLGQSAGRALEAQLMAPTRRANSASPRSNRCCVDRAGRHAPADPPAGAQFAAPRRQCAGPAGWHHHDHRRHDPADLGKEDSFDEEQQAQLAGALAHEIGHIEKRHSVRVMARSSLTAAASAALFGDFSVVAAGLPAVLMNTHYSRAMESEADGYAIAPAQAERHLAGAAGRPVRRAGKSARAGPVAQAAALDGHLDRVCVEPPARRRTQRAAAAGGGAVARPACAREQTRLRASPMLDVFTTEVTMSYLKRDILACMPRRTTRGQALN